MWLCFGVSLCWRMYLMSDPFLPALPVSNVSFHTSRLPADWSLWSRCYCLFQRFGFKRRQAFWGFAHICSLPLPLPFLLFLPLPPIFLLYVPLFKSSQASRSLCLLPLSSFKSRQVGANSLAVFLSFLSTFLFSVCGCSLYPSLTASLFPPNWVERKPWSTILKEGSQLRCIFYPQTHSLMDLAYCSYSRRRL